MKLQKIALFVSIAILISLSLNWRVLGIFSEQGFRTNEGFIIMVLMIIITIVSLVNIKNRLLTYTKFYLLAGVSSFALCMIFIYNTFKTIKRIEHRFEEFNNILTGPDNPFEAIGMGVYICATLSLILVFSCILNKQKSTLVNPPDLPPVPIQNINDEL
jgi:hypothetical protein